MATRPTVIVTRRLPTAVEARLEEHFDVQLNPNDRPMSQAELREAMSRADGVLCVVTDRMDATVIRAEPLRAKILANFGVGFNHIDLGVAKERGLVVTNTPGVLTEATADLAMMLVLMVARRAGEGERELRSGLWTGWRPTHLMGADVAGKTIGIIGLGRIGTAVARRAAAGFGMRVLVTTPRPITDPQGLDVTQAPLETLLRESDFVSLHCPATPETRHLINLPRLRMMRPTAFLINTARGDIVDEAALVVALSTGVIAGAGLDVYEQEPRVNPGLLDRENVVLLPHLGSATESVRTAMGMKAVDNLVAYFESGRVPDSIA